MMSLEPWTISGCGYPNLLATSGFCDGDTIHDRQSTRPVHGVGCRIRSSTVRHGSLGGVRRWENRRWDPAFPHRISAFPNPLSPIAHHWLDSTHISLRCSRPACRPAMEVEGSVFNGREPDERRYDFDFAALDSVAGRLWFLPIPSVASAGLGWAPQRSGAESCGRTPVDVDRFTTSAACHRPFGAGHFWATTHAWGANRELGKTTDGFLAESAVSLSGGHTWFGRIEVNGKPADDLHIHEFRQVFTVAKVQGEITRYFAPVRGLIPGIGATVSAALVPEALGHATAAWVRA